MLDLEFNFSDFLTTEDTSLRESHKDLLFDNTYQYNSFGPAQFPLKFR